MFGYVVPYKDELKIREYNIFRAYYCSLCKALSKEFYGFSRMGLNYDFTFLALLLSALDTNLDAVNAEVCIANPLQKKKVIVPNKYIEYSAGMNVILTYFKLKDNWQDKRSVLALLGMGIYLLPVKKARKMYDKQYQAIQKNLGELNALEKKECPVIDESADTFAKLMQTIFSPLDIAEDKVGRILGWMGYNLGRWIYILDAVEDIEKDIKQNQYNPVLLQYKYQCDETPMQFKQRILLKVEMGLTFTLDAVAKSYELLNICHHKSILDNIIYMGTRHRMEQIINKGVNNNAKSI